MYDFDNNNLYDYYTENQKKKKNLQLKQINESIYFFSK